MGMVHGFLGGAVVLAFVLAASKGCSDLNEEISDGQNNNPVPDLMKLDSPNYSGNRNYYDPKQDSGFKGNNRSYSTPPDSQLSDLERLLVEDPNYERGRPFKNYDEKQLAHVCPYTEGLAGKGCADINALKDKERAIRSAERAGKTGGSGSATGSGSSSGATTINIPDLSN